MPKTSIQWTDFSINPFRARDIATGATGHFCVKISDGCKYCYSSNLQKRFNMHEFVALNRGKVELFLHEPALRQVLQRKKPTKFFWCDMTDMFMDDYPDEWIDRCFEVMAQTPQHTHQVLTKRAGRMMHYSSALADLSPADRSMRIIESQYKGHPAGKMVLSSIKKENVGAFEWSLPNVWLGVSVENQQQANERIPALLCTPAAKRFVSYEPAIEMVDFTNISVLGHLLDALRGEWCSKDTSCLVSDKDDQSLDWIIVGGESGSNARAFDTKWARRTIRECQAASVAVFVKQLGRRPIDHLEGFPQADVSMSLTDSHGGDMAEWPPDLRVREFPGVR